MGLVEGLRSERLVVVTCKITPCGWLFHGRTVSLILCQHIAIFVLSAISCECIVSEFIVRTVCNVMRICCFGIGFVFVIVFKI